MRCSVLRTHRDGSAIPGQSMRYTARKDVCCRPTRNTAEWNRTASNGLRWIKSSVLSLLSLRTLLRFEIVGKVRDLSALKFKPERLHMTDKTFRDRGSFTHDWNYRFRPLVDDRRLRQDPCVYAIEHQLLTNHEIEQGVLGIVRYA